ASAEEWDEAGTEGDAATPVADGDPWSAEGEVDPPVAPATDSEAWDEADTDASAEEEDWGGYRGRLGGHRWRGGR
ncbi:MAG: hypothetical protein HQL31_03980, partial [Planctomycetes bacterium]|nr:hypothetical protein [Planctomycetota bacterium]